VGPSGIGLAVAEKVALQGADVVIVSSNAERVQEAIRSIGSLRASEGRREGSRTITRIGFPLLRTFPRTWRPICPEGVVMTIMASPKISRLRNQLGRVAQKMLVDYKYLLSKLEAE
jgi:NAD(P)-dependent dehydrogenase (short-subunit alcohol dehydrogenase family)